MELAIPLIALGGMYIISNQTNTSRVPRPANEGFTPKNKNNFKNPKLIQDLPKNYPVENKDDILDSDMQYPNPNTASDKYFNQNAYQNKSNSTATNNIQDVYSLSGNYLATAEFKHNNMVPFYGAKIRGQVYNNNNAETILDNMSGSGSQIIKKTEQAPLFKPQQGLHNSHGTQNVSDFMQSRQNPVLRNNNYKPFDSINVGPGINKGYGSEGSGGFNSGMESREYWMDKTVNELRVDTNPKEEYSLMDHQGPASALIKNLGSIGKVEKNLVDGSYENTFDRWLKTTGAEKGTRNVAEEVVRPSNRADTSVFYSGAQSAAVKTAGYAPGIIEEPKRQPLKGPAPCHSNACGRGPVHRSDNVIADYTNNKNNRSQNNQPDQLGASFNRTMIAAVAPIMDMFKPTKKEEHVSNFRVYGNVGGEVPGNYVINPYDKAQTTVKETTMYTPTSYIGNQNKGAYVVSEQLDMFTQRDTTNTSEICGMSSKHGAMVYDANYAQINNSLKEPCMQSRMNHGNTSTLNTNMNISIAKNESDLINTWVPTKTSLISMGATKEMYGKTDMNPYNTSADVNRNESDLLTAFRANPYTHSLSSF